MRCYSPARRPALPVRYNPNTTLLWSICRRTVYIAQSVLLAKNLSFFV